MSDLEQIRQSTLIALLMLEKSLRFERSAYKEMFLLLGTTSEKMPAGCDSSTHFWAKINSEFIFWAEIGCATPMGTSVSIVAVGKTLKFTPPRHGYLALLIYKWVSGVHGSQEYTPDIVSIRMVFLTTFISFKQYVSGSLQPPGRGEDAVQAFSYCEHSW